MMQILTVSRVVESLAKLRKLGIHRNAIMYLCIKRAAVEQDATENIKIDFREFFERFLTVRNAPADRLNKPYIIPFESSDAKLWLNRNLAGSFAPSSIRPDNPVNTVITLVGTGASVRYSLKPDHAKQAQLNLFKAKVPVLDLAIFLYRDFGFDSFEMDAEKLLTVFKLEFGYLIDGKTTSDFEGLFLYNPESTPEDLFSELLQS